MPAHDTNPTPYPDVNAVLQVILSGAQAILGDQFVGMYLDGSLVTGDFDANRSDIDFVVVTAGEPRDDRYSALRAMHARFAASDSPWAIELEGSYIARQALRRHGTPPARHPRLERGPGEALTLQRHDSDYWIIHRSILREQGAVVAGPPPRTLIDPVLPDDLRRAVLDTIRTWWAPMLDVPAPVQHPGYQTYAILTMCRMRYTLHHGAIVSKPVAARWAQETLGAPWAGLIDRALAWRKDRQSTPVASVGETLGFIRFTVEHAQQYNLTTGER